ncbi:MAG: CD225/dispanin family protein [Dysgonamonadaceae bacterium]|nr:CD225/dispanin family protein [Dysgonamonadaceae bacterium]MDD4729610.1 CD225/dispanin family protein [Dysgonamonadaceae bacterium]
MKKYFYTDGTNKFGPFSLIELGEKNINGQTLIWFHGLSEWSPACNFPELYDVFVSSPPPITFQSSVSNSQLDNINYLQPPKTWLVESILATLFCCLPLGIVGIVNATKVESRFYVKDYDGALQASADAAKWAKLSFGIGIAVGVIYFIVALITGIGEY